MAVNTEYVKVAFSPIFVDNFPHFFPPISWPYFPILCKLENVTYFVKSALLSTFCLYELCFNNFPINFVRF